MYLKIPEDFKVFNTLKSSIIKLYDDCYVLVHDLVITDSTDKGIKNRKLYFNVPFFLTFRKHLFMFHNTQKNIF